MARAFVEGCGPAVLIPMQGCSSRFDKLNVQSCSYKAASQEVSGDQCSCFKLKPRQKNLTLMKLAKIDAVCRGWPPGWFEHAKKCIGSRIAQLKLPPGPAVCLTSAAVRMQ